MNNQISEGDLPSYTPQNAPRDFKGIWTPREIWLHPDLSPNEKFLWSEINSLFDRERGGCYASNEYLANLFKVSTRHIQNMLSKLKALGLLRELHFNGRQRVIAAIQPEQDLGSFGQPTSQQPRTIVHPRDELKFTPRTNLSSPPSYIESKEENKEECKAAGAAHPPRSSSSKSKAKKEEDPEKIAFRPNVTLTQHEYDRILSEVGSQQLEWMLDKLDATKASTGRRYVCDAATMNKGGWVRDAYAQQRGTAAAKTGSRTTSRLRAGDTNEYSDPKMWEENERRGREKLKKLAAEARAEETARKAQ